MSLCASQWMSSPGASAIPTLSLDLSGVKKVYIERLFVYLGLAACSRDIDLRYQKPSNALVQSRPGPFIRDKHCIRDHPPLPNSAGPRGSIGPGRSDRVGTFHPILRFSQLVSGDHQHLLNHSEPVFSQLSFAISLGELPRQIP